MGEEREVFKGQYIKRVTLETVPDGRVYERAYFRSGVCVIPVTDEGKIRCIREEVRATGEIRTKLISGYINDDEDPLACAEREAEEEIGLTAQRWDLLTVTTSEEGTVKKEQYYFVARNIKMITAHPDPEEKIEGYFDFTPDEIKTMLSVKTFGDTSTAFVLLAFVSNLWVMRP